MIFRIYIFYVSFDQCLITFKLKYRTSISDVIKSFGSVAVVKSQLTDPL